MPAAEPQPWPGPGRGSRSPVLAVLVLGERLEPPFDLSDPALELLDLTARRPELLHDRLGQALELPLERPQQAHPPGVQVLHRPLRPLLDIHAQLSDVDQRENLVDHRLAAAFHQLARVVPQLADQPLPPPSQPPDRSTNLVEREQPCLCLLHEALLFAADSCGSLGQRPAAPRPCGVRPGLSTALSGERVQSPASGVAPENAIVYLGPVPRGVNPPFRSDPLRLLGEGRSDPWAVRIEPRPGGGPRSRPWSLPLLLHRARPAHCRGFHRSSRRPRPFREAGSAIGPIARAAAPAPSTRSSAA